MNTPSAISLRYLAHAVRTHWIVASLVTAVLVVAGAAGVLSLKPAYTATAVVLLAPAAEELTTDNQNRGTPATDSIFIRSETAIMSSDEMSRTVIDRLQLAKSAEFIPEKGFKELAISLLKAWLPLPQKQPGPLSTEEVLLDRVLHRYQDKLSVFNDGRSKTVEISFTASDPRLAASIANAHAEAYLQEQSTRRGGTQQQSIEWLAREVDARAAAVRDAEAEIQQYQLKHGIVSARDSTVVDQRLSQLSAQLIDARRQLATQSALLIEIQQIRTGGDAGNAANLLVDDSLKELLQNRVQAEANLASLEKRFAPNHPTLLKQREELASINTVLKGQLQRLEQEAESSENWWRRQVDEINNAVAAETTTKVNQDRVAASLPSLVAQAQVKRTVFETVLNRYQTLLAERGFSAPAAAIVSHAVPPARPSFPKMGLFLTIAVMASMMGGALAAIAVQMAASRSMGLTAIADAVGLRPLVAIPRFKNASRLDGVVEIKDPRLFIESIRFLRDAVLDRRQDHASMVCLITSVLPRQGKSLIAMSLARAIARVNRSTLFMELDLRQPSASSLARRAPPAQGIAAVLEDRGSLAELITKDESTGLDMLLAEPHASTALDRLSSSALNGLLAKLRNRYDAIIIDSPPVGLVSDALSLAPLADQTILVAKDGSFPIDELKRTTRLLQDRGATIAGLVLTSVDPNDMGSVDKKTLHRYAKGVSPKPSGSASQESAAHSA